MNWWRLSPDHTHFRPRGPVALLKTVTKLHFPTYISSVGFRGAEGRRARSPLEFGSVTRPSELWARQPCWPGQSRGEHLRTGSGAARWIMGEIEWPCWSTCRHPWKLQPAELANGSRPIMCVCARVCVYIIEPMLYKEIPMVECRSFSWKLTCRIMSFLMVKTLFWESHTLTMTTVRNKTPLRWNVPLLPWGYVFTVMSFRQTAWLELFELLKHPYLVW